MCLPVFKVELGDIPFWAIAASLWIHKSCGSSRLNLKIYPILGKWDKMLHVCGYTQVMLVFKAELEDLSYWIKYCKSGCTSHIGLAKKNLHLIPDH
ncbi:hypothetical protein TNIN_255031 [Trichonephila inaurata madagascariensis]|uniref:Uncharacterized protein n=1 Tax=Trichonephila inaurata madagascariensis TaxID=2747483 RepID=A0A8X7BPA7_9ARAC|nr:hypothetical protein TNIN_255031 [Trichonephila inaurata madagascariensis]